VSGDTTPVFPREANFKGVVLRDLLHNPLKLTSRYWFGLVSALLIGAIAYEQVAAGNLPAFLGGSPERAVAVETSFMVYAAWVVFVLYCLWWGVRVAFAMNNVKRGAQWLAIANPTEIRRRFKKYQAELFGIEEKFAIVAYENWVREPIINNGRLKTHGKVEIEVEWQCSLDRDAILYLYSDTGDMQDDVRQLRTRSSARCLAVKRGGGRFKYVQSNVTADSNYNYYAWIELDFYGRLIVSVQNVGHLVQPPETPPQYAERFEQWKTAQDRIKAARQPWAAAPRKPDRKEQILDFIKEFATRLKTKEEMIAYANETINSQDLSAADRRELRSRVFAFIQTL
jgi:hypothetical protein